jgi:hypothetical protein
VDKHISATATLRLNEPIALGRIGKTSAENLKVHAHRHAQFPGLWREAGALMAPGDGEAILPSFVDIVGIFCNIW